MPERMRERARRRVALRSFPLAILALAGCGDLTAGGVAESEVIVLGDGPGDPQETVTHPSGGAAAPPGGLASNGATPQAGGAVIGQPFEGSVSTRVRVYLLSAGGDSIPITSGDREVQVDIRGELPASLGTVTLPPGSYLGVRVVFSRIEAEVLAGLGGLAPGGGQVVVDLGSEGTLVVERDTPVHLREGDRLDVAIGLRAPVWIASVATLPPPRIIPAATFQGLVELRATVR